MKPRVAFICVHNSCRSQTAEALGKLFTSDIFDSYSAGIEIKPEINQDTVRIIKDLAESVKDKKIKLLANFRLRLYSMP